MSKKVNIRRRIVLASAAVSVILFFITSPLLGFLLNFVLPPTKLDYAEVLIKDNIITLNWENPTTSYVSQYLVLVDGREIPLDRETRSFEFTKDEISSSESKNVKILYADIFSRKSDGVEFNLSRPLENNVTNYEDRVVDNVENRSVQYFNIVSLAIILSIIAGIFAGWIFLFNFSKKKTYFLTLFTSVVTFSYLSITLSYIFTEYSVLSRIIFSLIFSVVFYVLIYLLYLTVNILQNSLYYDLPLEQAAKASQFIFALISAYLILILFFGGAYSVIERIAFSTPFIFILTLGSISMIKHLEIQQAIVRSLSISITLLFSMVVLSLWPINYIYLILTIAVVYYILLSVSLEVRQSIGKYSMWEYSILVILVFTLLVFSSSWGINGPLI